jgi:ElaA protein
MTTDGGVPAVRKQIGEFHICSFDGLTTRELYEILRARADVFVGEEKILYPDADGIDYNSVHVFSSDEDGKVIAYLRMFPKADESGVVQMGRVLTREHGKGLGQKLLTAAMHAAAQYMCAREIYLESQKHAEGFYLKAGFETTSADFIEAGIPHVQMRRNLAARGVSIS